MLLQHVNELCKESFKEDPRFKDNVSLAVERCCMLSCPSTFSATSLVK